MFRSNDLDLASALIWVVRTVALLGVCLGVAIVAAACHSSPTYRAASAFVFVSRDGGGAGGLPIARETVLVEAGGLVQRVRETSEDRVVALFEGRVDADALFERLSAVGGLPEIGSTSDDGVEVDYVPPTVVVALQLPGRAPEIWEGARGSFPPDVARTIEIVDGLVGSLEEARGGEAVVDRVYLRAALMPPATARVFARQDVATAIERSALAADGALLTAVSHPYRLVAVPAGSNPFTPFHTRFQPRRSTLELVLEGAVLQVRSLVEESATRQEDPSR